jgi:hypothetical protein
MSCCQKAMRRFLTFFVLAGLGAAYLWQKQHEEQSSAIKRPPVADHAIPKPTASVSERDWMKRSLDRAAEVTVNARRQTKEAQDP